MKVNFTATACQPRRLPGNLPVAYLVTQVGNWGSGSDDVGLMNSTKASIEEGVGCRDRRQLSRLPRGRLIKRRRYHRQAGRAAVDQPGPALYCNPVRFDLAHERV